MFYVRHPQITFSSLHKSFLESSCKHFHIATAVFSSSGIVFIWLDSSVGWCSVNTWPHLFSSWLLCFVLAGVYCADGAVGQQVRSSQTSSLASFRNGEPGLGSLGLHPVPTCHTETHLSADGLVPRLHREPVPVSFHVSAEAHAGLAGRNARPFGAGTGESGRIRTRCPRSRRKHFRVLPIT